MSHILVRDKTSFEAHLSSNERVEEPTISRYQDLLRILEQMDGLDPSNAWKYAGIIALAEGGWSTSGIASRFDASEGTIDTWFDDVQAGADLDEDMWFREAHPKTFPDDRLWPDGYENPFATDEE